ncbi:MAG: hypothetical protein Q9171_004753 [Xanthocarpia ochracea]
MSFAPPIARDGFYYNGDLYVEVGNLNRHKRASIPEITAILRPDLNRSNAGSAALPSKDPVGHWYEAQLIHYGLPPSKDKARAKMRLLEALNMSKLDIPGHIYQLESQLKKDYAMAEKEAKAQYKAEMGAAAMQKSATASKKRKQPELGNTVNVNINIGAVSGAPHLISDVMAGTSVEALQPSAKKIKATAATAPKSTAATARKGVLATQVARREGTPATEKSVAKETSSKVSAVIQAKKAVKQTNSNDPARDRPIQTARKSAAVKKEPVLKKDPAVKKEPAVKKDPGAKRKPAVKKETPVKNEPIVKKAATVKAESPAKKGAMVKKEPPSPSQPKLGLLNGHYDISCPDLDEQFSSSSDEPMSLILCLNSPEVWGAYDFGMFSGVLHLQNRPWEPSEEPIPCRWRGRENGEGEMSFGDHCEGEISFLGDGRIEGWLNLFDICHFQGQRRPGPGTAPRSAASMQEEWDEYNEETYDYERRSRW